MSANEEERDAVEVLEEQLANARAARSKEAKAQYAIDLQARIDLEEQHGTIAAVKVSVFAKGQPTMALLKTPTGIQYKRYKDQIFKAVERSNTKDKQDAVDTLARSCWVYPASKEAQDSMLEAFPGLLATLASAATSLAEGKAEEEGKG